MRANSGLGRRVIAWVIVLALMTPIWSYPGISMTAAQDDEGTVTERLLSDISIRPPSSNGSMTVTQLSLVASSRTQSMVLETPIVIVIESGRIKMWTRAGTTIDGVPVTSSPATVYVEKSQTIVVPERVRFRIRAWGCESAELLFITLTA